MAVAAAIQQKYGIPAVPHIICSGFSKIETEYALIDLNFLGITNLLILRGDKAKHDNRFIPNDNGYAHASELQMQVNQPRYRGGFVHLLSGKVRQECFCTPFHCDEWLY